MTELDLAALRNGDERAFRRLVTDYHGILLRLALVYSPSRAVAEETVQETWLTVLQALDGFAGRAPLRTWICRILVNIARRRAGIESRSRPFSALAERGESPAVTADRFVHTGPTTGAWLTVPNDWTRLPEDKVMSRELRDRVDDAIAVLPRAQREVITLRDVEGWTAAEVSDLLHIQDGNQRVLLHRARNRVRQVLEDYLDSGPVD